MRMPTSSSYKAGVVMGYTECEECIAKAVSAADLSDVEDCNLQFNIIGGDSGVFYLDIRDGAAVLRDGDVKEEYRVKYIFTPAVLSRIMNRVVDPIYAYTTGKFKMLGDVALGRQVLLLLTKA